MVRFLSIASILISAGCAGAAWREDFDRLNGETAALPAATAPTVRAPATDADLDRTLSQPLELATLIAAARARNPELREAASRTRAGLEEVRRAGALDDPMLKLGT